MFSGILPVILTQPSKVLAKLFIFVHPANVVSSRVPIISLQFLKVFFADIIFKSLKYPSGILPSKFTQLLKKFSAVKRLSNPLLAGIGPAKFMQLLNPSLLKFTFPYLLICFK